ncbi:MAG: DNA cytosine methyltransferase [Aquabacterium sp.]|nr:DNA cytosine methyltransferase [Aquabacterium sp.]
MNELALFAGAGGGILAGHSLGWRTVCAVERDAYAAQVLAQRQNSGALRPFPIWSDVCTFDGRPWRGLVDVVSGGFPCQDISVAGKGAGIDGERSGMWGHMARIIGEVRPRFCYVENSPALVTRGLGRVLGDLATLGYDCRWTVLGAADVGAPHQRDRFWLVGADTLRDRCEADNGRQPVRDGDRRGAAHAPGWQEQQPGPCSKCGHVADAHQQPGHERRRAGDGSAEVRHADSAGLAQRQGQPSNARQELAALERADWWTAEPGMGRVVDELAHRVDRLKALGNGQVPRCAATAFRMLTAGMREPSNVAGEAKTTARDEPSRNA